jgi:7-cyano-7-deazaguanine synthase
VFGLPDILSKSALLGDADIPHGRYDDPSMKITVVHGRNLLFVATAIAAVTRPGDKLVTGVHAGDHPIYPDCRPRFWAAVRLAAEAYNISIITPFIRMDKAGVIKAGHAAGAPVGITWSCYEGMSVHCGKCGTCTERIEAFKLAGINDPTIYDKEA